MRLNGWQRIGIVISMVWLLSASGMYFYELKNYPSGLANYIPNIVYSNIYVWVEDLEGTRIFRDQFKPENINKDFADLINRTYQLEPAFSISGLLVFTLIPVILGWLITYLVFYTFNWIKCGFQR